MTNEEKIIMIADALLVKPETITENTNLSDMDEYDSMAKLALVMMFVDEFGKKLDVNEINSMKSIGDIMAVMN